MKKTLLSKLVLSIVLLSISFSVAYSQKCLQGWKYDLPISVSNTVFSSLADYQVKVVVNTASPIASGKMNVNGDDIRFADTVNCSTIPYWIESGINTSSTVIWIKMPTLAASSTKIIKMYYGNPNATAASNGDSTFMLFDDFTGSTLNTSKWKTYGSSNSGYAIIAGQIAVTAGTSSTNTIGSRVFVSSNSFSSPLIVEGLVTSTSGFYSALGILNSGTWDGYSLYYGDNTAGVNAGLHIGQDYSDDVDYASHIETTETNAGNLAGIWQLSWPTSNSQTGIWPGGTANANTTGVTLGSSV